MKNMKHLKGFNNFLNEKVDIDLLAVDMIDYYGNELPKKADDAKDFAKSREISDQTTIKKIWDRAKDIQKNGIDEAVSADRINAHAQKLEKLKKEAESAMKKYEKLMGSKNSDDIDEAYDDMIAALEKFMDHKKTAP